MKLVDGLLTLGATMRLTRLVVADDLGAWWIKAPLYDLVFDRIPEHDSRSRTVAINYLRGLDCKWCVGYWIAVGTLASEHLTRESRLRPAWRFVTGTLALNYLAATLSIVEDAGMIAADEANQ